MKFKKYMKEVVQISYGEERGETTKVKGHSHDYFFDRISGDGGTSYDSGHLHKIKAMVILSAKNHIHKMK
jgi:hypothetical protein